MNREIDVLLPMNAVDVDEKARAVDVRKRAKLRTPVAKTKLEIIVNEPMALVGGFRDTT